MIYMYTSKNQSFWNTLIISSVPYPCPKWGAPLRDRRAEAPPWEIDYTVELVSRPYLRLHVFVFDNHPLLYIGSDEGTPGESGRLPGNPVPRPFRITGSRPGSPGRGICRSLGSLRISRKD